MGNTLCKGGEEKNVGRKGEQRYFEGYKAGKESHELKKKYNTLLLKQKKIQDEKDILQKTSSEQNESIKKLEELLKSKKEEMGERMEELAARNKKLVEKKKEYEQLIQGKINETSNLVRELDQVRSRNIPQLEQKIMELEKEREVLVAENDALDGEIGELEMENDSMKNLLKHISERQEKKKKKLKSTIFEDSPISKTGY